MAISKHSRDDFSRATRQALLIRTAGFCSRPECRKMTVVPSTRIPSSFSVTGRAAHITAASPQGPRYSASLTTKQRKDAANGIWLCADCADLIDKGRGREFSIELLQGWKRRAEEEVANASLIRASAHRPAWLEKLRSPHYVNVPRVLHISEPHSLSPETAAALNGGFPTDRFIAHELHEVAIILRRLSIKAIDVQQLLRPFEQIEPGLPISFHRVCRTRNGAQHDLTAVENYHFEKSPLIYFDMFGYRYIFPYDPIWLTTTTAKSDVRSGTCTLAGISLVKRVDHSARHIVCSPLAFGVPDVLGIFG